MSSVDDSQGSFGASPFGASSDTGTAFTFGGKGKETGGGSLWDSKPSEAPSKTTASLWTTPCAPQNDEPAKSGTSDGSGGLFSSKSPVEPTTSVVPSTPDNKFSLFGSKESSTESKTGSSGGGLFPSQGSKTSGMFQQKDSSVSKGENGVTNKSNEIVASTASGSLWPSSNASSSVAAPTPVTAKSAAEQGLFSTSRVSSATPEKKQPLTSEMRKASPVSRALFQSSSSEKKAPSAEWKTKATGSFAGSKSQSKANTTPPSTRHGVLSRSDPRVRAREVSFPGFATPEFMRALSSPSKSKYDTKGELQQIITEFDQQYQEVGEGFFPLCVHANTPLISSIFISSDSGITEGKC